MQGKLRTCFKVKLSCMKNPKICLNHMKSAFATLVASSKEDIKTIEDIKESKELLELMLLRYVSSEFRRAQRYYEKLFERFPKLRSQCGVPTEKELIKLYGIAMSSRTPNPTPSPSPMPSPSTESPFPVFASSPMVTEVSCLISPPLLLVTMIINAA